MGFGLWLIVLLLAVGGFAAYQGDRVGMLVGRRRLSIFGLRPRYTSRIVSVLTGVFIVLITLISLIVLSSSVRQALFGMERLRTTVLALSDDVTSKNAELLILESQRQKLAQEIQNLSVQNQQLQNQNTKLRADTSSLTKRNTALQQERLQLEAERQVLAKQLTDLRKAGDYYFDQAARLRQANSSLRQADFVYHALDVVDSTVVEAHQPSVAIRRQLSDLVATASQRVILRGAGDQATGVGVRIDRVITQKDNKITQISADTVIDLAVAAIQSDPAVQSVIVQLVALTNAARGETVLADFNLIRNERLYAAHEVVAQKEFDGGMPASRLFEDFILWMQVDIRQTVSQRGLMPQNDGTFGGVTPEQAYAVIDAIAAHNGPVTVQAFAEKECWTRGPLALGFNIQKAN